MGESFLRHRGLGARPRAAGPPTPPLVHRSRVAVCRVSWFCSLKGNEFFAEVEHEFMQDEFNMTGLSAQVPYFEYALDTILDAESVAATRFSKDQQEAIESAAELLYGLIHARYIITPRGLNAMLEKYKAVHFGRCPRVHCQGQPVLPVGQVGGRPRAGPRPRMRRSCGDGSAH